MTLKAMRFKKLGGDRNLPELTCLSLSLTLGIFIIQFKPAMRMLKAELIALYTSQQKNISRSLRFQQDKSAAKKTKRS